MLAGHRATLDDKPQSCTRFELDTMELDGVEKDDKLGVLICESKPMTGRMV
jgi:hypothetical protein